MRNVRGYYCRIADVVTGVCVWGDVRVLSCRVRRPVLRAPRLERARGPAYRNDVVARLVIPVREGFESGREVCHDVEYDCWIDDSS